MAADGSSGWVGGNSTDVTASVIVRFMGYRAGSGALFPVSPVTDQRISCNTANSAGDFETLIDSLCATTVDWLPAAQGALPFHGGMAAPGVRGAGVNDNTAAHGVSVSATAGPGGPLVAAWVEPFDAIAGETGIEQSDLHAAVVHTGQYGRVMLTRFSVVHDGDGMGIGLRADGSNVVRLASAGSGNSAPGVLASANDNVVWVGDEDGTGSGGAIGRDAQAVALVTGETIVTWVDLDGTITGKAYPADGSGIDADAGSGDAPRSAASTLSELLSGIANLAPDQRYRLLETGRDGFAILWAATLAGAVVLQGRHFGAPEDEGGAWTVGEFRSAPLEPGFKLTTDFQVLGWHGERGNLDVTYEVADGTHDATVQVVPVLDQDTTTPVSSQSDSAPAGTTAAIGSSGQYHSAVKPANPAEPSDVGPAMADPTSSKSNQSAPTADEIASIHAGIVEDANLIVADNSGNRLDGTAKDDVILADVPATASPADSPIAGGDDYIAAGLGNDVIYGGGGDDLIDGGGDDAARSYTDTAILTGDSRDYSITANGDGTYTVVLARSDTGSAIDRSTSGFEGVDTADGIEQYQFLTGDLDYITKLVNGADIGQLDTSHHGVVLASDLYGIPDRHDEEGSDHHDGTPGAWGSSRDENGDIDNTIEVARDGASADLQGPIGTATGHGGFAVGWVDDGTLHVAAYDALGRRIGTFGGETADPIDTAISPAMDGAGDGVAVAYSSSAPNSDSSNAETTISVQVIGHDDDECATLKARIEVDGGVSGLDLAGGNAGGLISVAWAETAQGSDSDTGEIVVQRFVAANHDEGDRDELDATGLDGQAGVGPDTAETIGTGRAPAITDTNDDGFAVAWVGETETVEGRIFDAIGIMVEGFSIPVGDGRHLREGTGPTIETTGSGDIFVSWQVTDDNAGGLAIMSALLRHLGPSEWSSPIIRELRHFDDEPGEISIAVAGQNGDAIIMTWRHDGDGGGEITGQRYSVDAIAGGATDITVGLTFEVVGGDGESHDNVSVTGLDDGRVVVVSRETDDRDDDQGPSITVQAAILDTRNPADILISADDGAAQDTHVGTIGDDIVDGRASQDQLYGALGDDVLTGGTGDDRLDGGEDNDTLLGGSGSDHLDGGDGDDLLMGGFGRDYIVGGDGEDTLSYRGETRDVTVDLETGIVRSDAAHNAVSALNGNLSVDGVSAETYNDTGVEDLLGRLETNNCGSDGGVAFVAGHDIENIEGGLGSDTLLGDSQDNTITGGKGDDVLDGRDGIDTASFSGNSADYDITAEADGSFSVRHARNTSANSNDGADTLRNIEHAAFADGMFALQSDGALSPASIAEAFGIASEISIAAMECFDFADLDDLDGETSGSGSSGKTWDADDATADLYGLGSDTLHFGDLDALCDSAGRPSSGYDHDDLFNSDGLDYSSCTILASQAEIEAAMSLDGPDSLDAMTTTYDDIYKIDNCDPTEFRIG